MSTEAPSRAEQFSLRSFRVGMATAMARSRKPLHEILRAGGWRSGAFHLYLSQHDLDAEALIDLFEADDEASGEPNLAPLTAKSVPKGAPPVPALPRARAKPASAPEPKRRQSSILDFGPLTREARK